MHSFTALKRLAGALLLASNCVWASTEEANISLSLDNADIIELVRWASDVTDKNIILHPNVKGRVTVLAGEGMNLNDAYEVFLSVLQVHGLTVVEDKDTLKVIPDATAKQNVLPVTGNADGFHRDDMVVQVVKVNNVSAAQVLNLLRPLVPQAGYIAAYPQTNTLIVAERANKIEQINQIIKRIDRSDVVTVEMIELEFASAKDVFELINRLMPGGKEGAPGSFTLATDERSNSLLITGDPVTRQQIQSLVQRLDRPLQGQGNTQVIRVQYANAEELVPLLQSISGSVSSKIKDQAVADADISIEPHKQLNALVITAPPSLLSTLKGVIRELDVPRAQVLVEALIVEVNEELAHNLGIQWQTNSPDGSGSEGFAGFNNFPNGLTPLSLNDNGQPALGSGLSLGYLRSGDLRLIVNALSGETDANILSTPTILALDNEEASILVGSNVPFITGTQQRAGDLNAFNTIERQDIGLSLKVKPRINNNDSVTLEIDQAVENITRSTVETADIVTNKREIKTRVLIENDQILVLGGLIRDEYTETENKVPLLGDIPGLGKLFKSNSTTLTKANLMVFIHPKILHNPESLAHYSRGRYDSMRERQLSFGKRRDNFFVLKDKPLLPELPVLDSAAPSTGHDSIHAEEDDD